MCSGMIGSLLLSSFIFCYIRLSSEAIVYPLDNLITNPSIWPMLDIAMRRFLDSLIQFKYGAYKKNKIYVTYLWKCKWQYTSNNLIFFVFIVYQYMQNLNYCFLLQPLTGKIKTLEHSTNLLRFLYFFNTSP